MDSLKEKMQVVMLPTDKKPVIYKNQLVLGRSDNMLDLFSDHTSGPEDVNEAVNHLTKKFTTPQHLYICSNREIKGPCWAINKVNKDTLFFIKDPTLPGTDLWMLVEASTDKSLGLPEPSKEFIEAYIKQYNAGSPITEVMVDMEYRCKNGHSMCYKTACVYPHCEELNSLQPVVKSDNTITITKVVDDWDDLLNKFLSTMSEHATQYEEYDNKRGFCESYANMFKEWLEENDYLPPTKKK